MHFPHPVLLLAICLLAAEPNLPADIPPDMQAKFDALNSAGHWQVALTDPGSADWREHWFLDGEKAKVTNTPTGMELRAGETPGEDAGHMVLWTRQEFVGEVRARFKFTRLDESKKFVNILYLKATGTGEGGYEEDIAKWSDLRKVSSMKTYYERMKLWHLSFAAFGGAGPVADYIRARRYPTEGRDDFKRFDQETVVPPDYEPGGLFATGVEHRMTAIQAGNDLFLYVTNGTEKKLCHWDLAKWPPLDHGRIGLRLMASRAARIADFEVATRPIEP